MVKTHTSVGCVEAATDILGDKWSPRLLRFFINNEIVRFCQLQDLSGGINPRTLSARLVRLEERGIISKLPTKATARCEYILTEKGKDLMPVLQAMEKWSSQHATTAR